MRDQAELARECLAAEERGEDVIAYLKGRGFISPRATWERLQINYLGRGKRNWKGEIQLAEKMKKNQKVTAEQKAQAVEIAIQGGDPLAYLQECGSGNATSLWYMIRKALQKTDPEKYEELKAHYKPAPGRKKKAEAEADAEADEVESEEVAPGAGPAEAVVSEEVDGRAAVEAGPEKPDEPKIYRPLMYDGMEACGWKGKSGKFIYHSGRDLFEYDNGHDELCFLTEWWRVFLRDLVHASNLCGVDLGVDLRD